MAKWKLTVKDPESLLWARSSVKQDVIIEAKSEQLARLEAARRFGLAACKASPGEDLLTSSRLEEGVVSCQRL